MQPASLAETHDPTNRQEKLFHEPKLFLMVNSLEMGGTETQFVRVANQLSQSQYRVSLGCIMKAGPLLSQLKEIKEFRLGGSFYNRQALWTACSLIRDLRRTNSQIVHSFDFYTNVLLAPCAYISRRPIIIGSHRQLGDLLTPSQFRVQMMAFRFCNNVVCNSQAAAKVLADHGLPTTKITVIPNSVPADYLREAAPLFPRDSSRVRVGMIARMNSWEKGHKMFLQAAQIVAAKYTEVEFVLAGDGSLRDDVAEMIAKLGLTNRTRFLGNCEDVPSVLAALDITVNASGSESQSNSILESMAAGVPVCAFKVGGNPEIIRDGENGLLASDYNAASLALAIEKFIADGTFRQVCGRRARQFILENFSADQTLKRYTDLYERLLDETAR